MNKRNKIAAALLLALAAPTASMAQNTLRSAYFTEGYTYRHHMNPAFANERNYVSMPLLGLGNFNIGLQSTVGVKDFIHKLPDGSLTTFLNDAVDANDFLGGLKNRNRLNLDFDMTLLSFGFHKWGGFNTFDLSIKSGTRMNLPKDLFEFAKVGMNGATEYNLKDMGMFTNNYAEIALGHSRKIMDGLTVGAKVKFLLGIYNADFHVNDMKLVLSDEKWAVSGDGEFSSGGIVDIPTKLKTKEVTENGITRQETEEELDFDNIEMGDPIGGFGMAFDLGATYKVREDLEVSLALLDLGWISYKNATKATMAAEPWEFPGFQNVPFDSDKPGNNIPIEDQIDNLEDDLEDLFQMKASGKGKHARAEQIARRFRHAKPLFRKGGRPLRHGRLGCAGADHQQNHEPQERQPEQPPKEEIPAFFYQALDGTGEKLKNIYQRHQRPDQREYPPIFSPKYGKKERGT